MCACVRLCACVCERQRGKRVREMGEGGRVRRKGKERKGRAKESENREPSVWRKPSKRETNYGRSEAGQDRTGRKGIGCKVSHPSPSRLRHLSPTSRNHIGTLSAQQFSK